MHKKQTYTHTLMWVKEEPVVSAVFHLKGIEKLHLNLGRDRKKFSLAFFALPPQKKTPTKKQSTI